ncbi:MAG: hypothetical protein NWF05_10145 [Candidatus Bathyarchaeota archaeon]|nr:hypothetical protein [Candidatus Bathyarchaeota archaeon]
MAHATSRKKAYAKTGNLQKFLCLDCPKYFTFTIGFERMKHNPQAVTIAIQLSFSGESLRHTAESLKQISALNKLFFVALTNQSTPSIVTLTFVDEKFEFYPDFIATLTAKL